MSSRKETIHEAAAKLFRKKGYAATSVQDIADAVGIKAASLYNHINSKQEILKELCMPIASAFSLGMEEIENSSLNPLEKLEQLVTLHLKLTIHNGDRMTLITGDWIHLDAEDLKKFKLSRSKYETSFKSILNSAKNESLINPKINIDVALFSILSSLHWLYSWKERHQDISSVELEKQLKECLLGGLRIAK